MLDLSHFQRAQDQHRADLRATAQKLSTAQNLTNAISTSAGSSQDEEDAAKTLFETYKDAVELSGNLARSAQSAKDGARGQRISKIKQKIEQLKEMLRYATPEQAKRLIKQLKQISKEFKTAAADFHEAGASLSSANAGTSLAASAGIVSAVAATGGPGETTQSLASSALASGIAQVSADPQANASPAPQLPPASSPAATNEAAAAQAEQEAPTPPEDEDETEGGGDWRQDLQTAIQSYVSRHEDSNRSERASKASALKEEGETLREIAREIKLLAKRLKSLAKQDDEGDKDDKDAKKDLRDILENVEKGLKKLNQSVPQTQAAEFEHAADAGEASPESPDTGLRVSLPETTSLTLPVQRLNISV